MSYVPPHKRMTQEGASPTPEQLTPQIKKHLNIRSSRSSSNRKADRNTSSGTKIVYADHSISRWLAVPLTDDGRIPSSAHLLPVSLESVGWKSGEKPLSLVDDQSKRENSTVKSGHLKSPWASVAENIHSDLLSTFNNVRNEMGKESLEDIKPAIVARFGKVLFRRSTSLSLDSLKERPVSEASLRELRRTFFTNVPISYMEDIKSGAAPKIGFDFEEEKEQYHVKLADAMRPDSTISCKCRVYKDGKRLELHKIELNPVRNLIVDISCLDSNVDLRLALCAKRTVTALTDEEKQTIRDLVNSAMLDQNLKGGLKWPLGKANSGARYSVVGVWHTKIEFYRNSSMKLKMREADRYDFLTSTGEVTREVVLKLTGLTKHLLEQRDEDATVSTLLEDTLKFIWDAFLGWNGSLVSHCES